MVTGLRMCRDRIVELEVFRVRVNDWLMVRAVPKQSNSPIAVGIDTGDRLGHASRDNVDAHVVLPSRSIGLKLTSPPPNCSHVFDVLVERHNLVKAVAPLVLVLDALLVLLHRQGAL